MPVRPALGNPRRLTRVLEQLAAGNRRPRGIALALDLEARIVQGYLLAGAWLGLVALEPEAHLTRVGVDFVYAGVRRGAILSALVHAHPGLSLIAGAPPSTTVIATRMRASHPELSVTAARRQAISVRRLVESAWRVRRRVPAPEQLGFSFASHAGARVTPLDPRAGVDESPDAYGLVLRALLDAGELSPPRLRAVLDAGGGADCPIGAYIAMAIRRGDGVRQGEDLVVTSGAVARRDLADSVVSIALSDPDFRAHVAARLAGQLGDTRRFGGWMKRIFDAGDLAPALDRLLFGRTLASFPCAGSLGAPITASNSVFTADLGRAGMAFCLPSCLTSLTSGLGAVNRSLRAANPQEVRLPNVVDRRWGVHGGILAPGELSPRAVPDLVSLRGRLLRAAPAFALLTAFAGLNRRGALRLRPRGGEVFVESRGRATRTFGDVVEGVAARRDWLLVRGPGSASWPEIADVAESLGILARSGEWLVLDESLFLRLQTDPEHRQVWEALQPLADIVESVACAPLGG